MAECNVAEKQDAECAITAKCDGQRDHVPAWVIHTCTTKPLPDPEAGPALPRSPAEERAQAFRGQQMRLVHNDRRQGSIASGEVNLWNLSRGIDMQSSG